MQTAHLRRCSERSRACSERCFFLRLCNPPPQGPATDAVIIAMQGLNKNAKVQTQGCRALRNLVRLLFFVQRFCILFLRSVARTWELVWSACACYLILNSWAFPVTAIFSRSISRSSVRRPRRRSPPGGQSQSSWRASRRRATLRHPAPLFASLRLRPRHRPRPAPLRCSGARYSSAAGLTGPMPVTDYHCPLPNLRIRALPRWPCPLSRMHAFNHSTS